MDEDWKVRYEECAAARDKWKEMYEAVSVMREQYKRDWVDGLKHYGAARGYIERLEALAWHASDRLAIWHREAPERAGQFVGDLAKELEAVLAQGYPGQSFLGATYRGEDGGDSAQSAEGANHALPPPNSGERVWSHYAGEVWDEIQGYGTDSKITSEDQRAIRIIANEFAKISAAAP